MANDGAGWLVRGEGDAKTVWIGDQPATFKVRGETGDVGLFEMTIPPGSGSPIHVHPRQDETHYVLKGEFEFLCEDDRVKAGPGSVVFVSKLVPHALRNVSAEPGRLLFVESPPGPLEEFILRVGTASQMPPGPPDMEMLTKAADETAGIDILAPPDAW